MSRKKTHEEFLEEVKALVGDEYEVLGEYINARKKIEIKHNECGYEWDVIPNNFLRGSRCPECFGKHKKTTEMLKKDVFDLVGDEHEVLGEYKNSHTKILFKHNECSHEYEATPSSFLQGRRCPKCAGRCRTTESFKQEIYNLVGDEYEVLGEYINNQKKIKMKHNECGCVYRVQPRAFLMGTRCPKCASSKGEKRVSDFLKLQKKSFQEQYRFDDCRYKKPLPFDFAIFNPDNTINCLIEYDGKQHYESIEHWGGEEDFKGTQKRDQIKNQYCKDNNIKLIRIPYWDFDNIEDILNEELKDLINSSEDCTQQAS